ncbi:MAG: hypothetical protein JWR19_419 [Pedosphaera sp.]|nr:hypothetical protein [Pedosphaera sp.]
MTTTVRWLSALLFISALGALTTLLLSDTLNHLRLTPIHQQASALSLMLIGSSYIGLQLLSRQRWQERLKAVLLGFAFVLWGGEQFLPTCPWVTAMDSLVILIFVADLSWIIVERLKRTESKGDQ